MASDSVDWEDTLREILRTDSRYDSHAYLFVDRALRYAMENLPKDSKGKTLKRHVSGMELSRAFLELLFKESTGLAPAILEYWGVLTGRDIGNIVYTLIEWKIMSASPEDRLEDFDEVGELIPILKGLSHETRPNPPMDVPENLFPRID